MAKTHQTQLYSQASSETDRARLLAASSTHSGDWFHAAPIVSIGLRLSDEATRIAVAHKLDAGHVSHTFGSVVRQSTLEVCTAWPAAASQPDEWHHMDWRAVKRAQIPAVEEPAGLLRSDGKRPDEATLIPGPKGNWGLGRHCLQ